MARTPQIEGWTTQLASAIAAAVSAFAPRLHGEEIVAFDVGCFPWHGTIELSILTAQQAERDNALLDPREVTAWPHYNFSAGLASWASTGGLTRSMAEAYRANEGDERAGVVETFLRASAQAVGQREVSEALGALSRSPHFRVTILHPDQGTDYFLTVTA